MIEYENLYNYNLPFISEFKTGFNEFLDSGSYVLGDQVTYFENEFSEYLGAKYCVGVGNCLDAMTISLLALEIEKGREVIVASNTYVASILSIIHAGLKPVLVEPDQNTLNIDTSKIEEKITKNTAAILPVHLYGTACDMQKIEEIAKLYNLYIVEDCAQSHGAKFNGKLTGTLGDMGCFSFYPTKNLGALGDGGAIVTNNPDYAEKCISLRNYGSNKKYYNQFIGYNSRLDEIQAGFLRTKLKYLNEIKDHKRVLAKLYLSNLSSDVVVPNYKNISDSVFHIFPIRLSKRDELKRFLEDRGIGTEIHYPVPPHKQIALRSLFEGKNFPLSEEIHRNILSLPISYIHSEEDIKVVCKRVNQFIT